MQRGEGTGEADGQQGAEIKPQREKEGGSVKIFLHAVEGFGINALSLCSGVACVCSSQHVNLRVRPDLCATLHQISAREIQPTDC